MTGSRRSNVDERFDCIVPPAVVALAGLLCFSSVTTGT